MNNVYLKSKNSEKKSILKLIYLLIPFLVYGLYKNGILLYKNNYGNLISLFRLPLLITISLLISYFFSKYKKEFSEENYLKIEGLIRKYISYL